MVGWDLLKIQVQLNTSETLEYYQFMREQMEIQALDLLKRKLPLDGGKTFEKLLNKIKNNSFRL